MNNLFKTDMKKMLTDKLVIISMCIVVGFALLMPFLLYAMDVINKEYSQAPYVPIPVRSYTMSLSFNLITNVGIVVTILITIMIGKEFTNGNIRNKIIVGNRRKNIFLSLFLSHFIILVSLMIISTIIMTLLSIAFLPYDTSGAATGELILDFFLSLVLGILLISIYVAMGAFFTVALNKTALGIVVPIILSVFLFLLSSFLVNVPDTVKYLNFVQSLSSLNASHMTMAEFAIKCIPAFILTPTFLVSGMAIFDRIDVK